MFQPDNTLLKRETAQRYQYNLISKMQRSLTLYQVDAFTNKPFGGNPAAVCLLRSSDLPLISDNIRQLIAGEMNLSETAFLETLDATATDNFTTCSTFRLRWFTPTIEVPLCGHATLAAAAALVLGEGNQSPILSFQTLSGTLTVQYDWQSLLFKMSLPAIVPTPNLPYGTGHDSDLITVLLGRNNYTHSDVEIVDILYAPSVKYLLVAVSKKRGGGGGGGGGGEPSSLSSSIVANIEPDGEKLKQAHPGNELIGIIVTEVAGGGNDGQDDGSNTKDYVDFVSRFFAPWAGIIEDPVTGSAHSPLAMYWSNVLGKSTMVAHQISKRRGELYLNVVPASLLSDGGKEGRVEVSGHAVITIKGKLLI
jgi:predicted PhzF superfamily epimerase YddE/YHI9